MIQEYESIRKKAMNIMEQDVKHQPHYDRGGIQPIEFMLHSFTKDEFRGFLKGNIIKYTSRAGFKNGVEDLKKAKVYLEWLVDFEEHGHDMVLFPERVKFHIECEADEPRS